MANYSEAQESYPSAGVARAGLTSDRMDIRGRLNVHREELLKLREMVGILGDRLTPVLGPEVMDKFPGESLQDSPELSEMARDIDDQTQIIYQTQRMLSNITGRVEL